MKLGEKFNGVDLKVPEILKECKFEDVTDFKGPYQIIRIGTAILKDKDWTCRVIVIQHIPFYPEDRNREDKSYWEPLYIVDNGVGDAVDLSTRDLGELEAFLRKNILLETTTTPKKSRRCPECDGFRTDLEVKYNHLCRKCTRRNESLIG